MPDPIPIEPFEEDEPGPKPTLGPASIAEAMRPLEAIGGEAVIVFIRDNVDSSDVAIPLVPLPAADLVRILPALIADRAGLTLVSDGNMSHAVSVNEERGGRFIYFDPWNTSSFLQAGRNVAGVQARAEEKGTYSVTAEELARVIVAEGVAALTQQKGLVVPQAWDQFRATDFYTFFHLRPDGDRVKLKDGSALPHKPGAFQEFLDLGFELDPKDRLRAGVLEVRQEWLLGPGRMLGLDLLKSFIRAMVATEMNLSSIGVVEEAVVPCPDLHLSEALVDVLAALQRGKHPSPGARLNAVMPFIGAIAGKVEEAQLAFHFHNIRMVSRAGTLLVRIEHVATDSPR